MTNFDRQLSRHKDPMTQVENNSVLKISLQEARQKLQKMKAEERLQWAVKEFGTKFVLTTSFGIQSAVLLNMISNLGNKQTTQVIWIDTGYLPTETYSYAEQLINLLNLNIIISQSKISPARMEALYGKLWETGSIEDLEKYHQIRKINPLEETFDDLKTLCWGSGVRGDQTKHRNSMTHLDAIRDRLSLRPILDWSPKDIFYYMEENNLPQHPLFAKGYSSVGDWHSSEPEKSNNKGRSTRFRGLKEECGIHTSENNS